MSANSFGSRFQITSFGESHGPALGVVIDGCPAGIPFDREFLAREMERRKPGQSGVVSARKEPDVPEILSGVFEGRTLGTPIAMLVRNADARSEDYKEIAQNPRAGHADDMWKNKFGHSDPRGGGRSSGRETVARVMAGAVAKMALRSLLPKARVVSFAQSIGPYELDARDLAAFESDNGQNPADRFVARFPSLSNEKRVEELLLKAKEEGKSYGGIGIIWIEGLPAGLGQPVFHKLKADLAAAIMSVGATSGIEVGAGFAASHAEGSAFHSATETSPTDAYGGIRGGISTGERISLKVGFKPTSSVLDIAKRGRHDPCIVPRALPVLEAMCALVVVDHLLWARTDRA